MATIDHERKERLVQDHPLLQAPTEVPADLAALADEQGWPDGAAAAVAELRVPRADLRMWLDDPQFDATRVGWLLDVLAKTFDGPLRVREATWRDGEAVVDLYANAPEGVGDWRLDVLRGPNPYAPFRLQEHPNLQLVECRGVVLGAAAHATRNSLVAGQRLSVHFISAWRVREGFRGYGLANVLQMSAGPARRGSGSSRTGTSGSATRRRAGWTRSRSATSDELTGGGPRDPGRRADGRCSALGEGAVIRPVRPDDLPRCIELINRTHAGLDLFRPYTVEFLESHLDDPAWGPKPAFWSSVFDVGRLRRRRGRRRRPRGVRWALGPRARHPRGVDQRADRRGAGRSRPPPSWTGATRPGRADAHGRAARDRSSSGPRSSVGPHLLAPLEHTPGPRRARGPAGSRARGPPHPHHGVPGRGGADRRRADEAVHRPRLLVMAVVTW